MRRFATIFVLFQIAASLHAREPLTLRWLVEGEVAITLPAETTDIPEREPLLPAPGERGSRFALQLFREVVHTQPTRNTIFSPASVESVLHLLSEGARGKTAEELAGLPCGKADSPTTIQLHEANALFVDESVKLHPDVPHRCIYPVPLRRLPAKAAAGINAWVQQQTSGMIPAMVSPAQFGSDSPALIVANAIALEGKWLHPFDRMQTVPGYPFARADGSSTTVCMMFNEAQYRSAAGEDWVAVALMLRAEGRSGHHGCLVGILPLGNAQEFASSLSHEKYESIRRALALATPMQMRIGLPAFETLTPSFSLKEPLQACGLSSIFSPAQADLGGFCDTPLYVRDIQQRCFVKLDETGVKAAAVTIANSWDLAIHEPPHELIFDRPFIWLITELTGPATPRFMGFYTPD